MSQAYNFLPEALWKELTRGAALGKVHCQQWLKLMIFEEAIRTPNYQDLTVAVFPEPNRAYVAPQTNDSMRKIGTNLFPCRQMRWLPAIVRLLDCQRCCHPEPCRMRFVASIAR